MPKTIKFVHDWNGKLGKGARVFTTIRKADIKKAEYYAERIGETFHIGLKDEIIGEARLLNIWCLKFSEINPPLLMLDTGLVEDDEIKELFKNFGIGPDDAVLVLAFKKEF